MLCPRAVTLAKALRQLAFPSRILCAVVFLKPCVLCAVVGF